MKYLTFAFGLLFALATLQSCEKGDTNSLVSDSGNGAVSQYCQEIDDYVAANYPNSTIVAVTIQGVPTAVQVIDGHVVELDNGPCLFFDMDCIFLTDFATCPD